MDFGRQIDTSGLPIERRTRHNLEVARALSAHNRTGDALSMILEAEQWAPEQARSHYLAHDPVLTWVRNQRGRPSRRWRSSPTGYMSSEVATLGHMAASEHEAKMAHPRMAAGALFFDAGGRVLMVRPTYKDHCELAAL